MKIFVKAKTNTNNDEIIQIDQHHYEVSTVELPVKGRANLAIIKLLADYFKVKMYDITLIKGFSSKIKIFNINKN